jgi:anti-sigma B factor antagonist
MSDGTVTQVQPHERVLLLAVQKRSLDEDAARLLTEEVLAAAAQRPDVLVVLDLGRVRFAPSVVLGSLDQLGRNLRLERRRLAIVGLEGRVRDTFRVTRLDKLLEVYDSLAQAVAAPPSAPGS